MASIPCRAARVAASHRSLATASRKGQGKGRLIPRQNEEVAGREPAATVEQQVERKMQQLQDSSKGMMRSREGDGKFAENWNASREVPYRFRIKEATPRAKDGKGAGKGDGKGAGKGQAQASPPAYSDYAGLRFPTLETAENYDYHKDRGLTRLIERAYPIKVPGYRRLDPYLREYIFFLHNLDPVRFTIRRISERYRMREKTVAKVVQEWGANRYLTRSGLTKISEKQTTREEVILAKKEEQFAKWVGWDQLGDEEDLESDDEALGDYKGWRSTSDWVRRQSVEVEMMSAFPMMEKRDPMPKRVDVDMVVESKQNHKIMNWIDPTDKVVF